MNPFKFLVFCLAVYRVTRLLIEDEILDEAREFYFSKVKYQGKLYTLATCYWCLGFWVSIVFAILYVARPNGMMVAGLPLASSAVVGFISQKV